MNDRTRNSFRLNTRSTSPSTVRKKQPTSYMGERKKYITVNIEMNKRRKGSGAVSKKVNKKKYGKIKPESSQID